MVSAILESSQGVGKVGMEEEEEESLSSSSDDLPSNTEGQGKQVEDDEEESSSKEDEEDVDLPLTKLRHQKPSADEVNFSFKLVI
jgi:hypothetical protein